MLQELRAVSRKLGADALLVQAAGGNTSIKKDGVMWIKASGTWLKDAETKEIFVPLDLSALHAALQRDDPACEACTDFVRDNLNTLGLRPSIETSVHGLMPQAVVLHVHCVNTIAWAIQWDAEVRLKALLHGLPWVLVPYARPGLQLSRAIRAAVKPETSILVLQNHGLAVAADSVAEAEDLLRLVVQRLRRPSRDLVSPNYAALEHVALGQDYLVPNDANAHGFALDPLFCKIAMTAVFYPDHAVFLGTEVPSDPRSQAPAIAIPGAGVLVHRDAKPGIEPMLGCLTDVFRRLEGCENLKALTTEEVGALLNWDAEKYRQALKV